MGILNKPLDQDGHAIVDLLLRPAFPRRKALQTAGQAISSTQVIWGMLDTGATLTVIDPQVRQTLGLTPFRMRRISAPGLPAPAQFPSYKLELMLVDPAGQVWLLGPMLTVLEAPILHMGVSVLVGCDVLSRCIYNYNGPAGTFSLAY